MSLVTTPSSRERVDYRKSQRLSVREGGTLLRGWTTGGASTTGAVVIDTLYAVPLYLPDTIRVAHLYCEVTTASAGNIRMGLYDDLNNYPNNRLVTETEITTAGTVGVKRQAIGLTLPYGFYWMVAVFSSTPTMRSETASVVWLGFTSGSDTGYYKGYSVAFTYAALPTPFTASGTFSTATMPKMFVQIGKHAELP